MKQVSDTRNVRRTRTVWMLVWCFCLLFSGRASAKTAEKLRFKKTAVTLYEKDRVYLKVVVYSKKKVKKTLTFTSSRPGVATVDAYGVLKARKAGKTRIRVTGKKKKAAVCLVTVKKRTGAARVSVENGKIKVVTDDVKRIYIPYYELFYTGYLSGRGCVHTAVAVAASAFGQTADPRRIHEAPVSDFDGERYAVAHMKTDGSYPDYYGVSAISVRTAEEILKNMGIPVKTVTGFTTTSAVKEIRAHLKKGNPVIVKVNNSFYSGVNLTSGHHAMVLLGLDARGKVILYDTAYGRINVAAMNGARINMTLKTLVEHFMTSPKAEQDAPYVMSLANAGGYILVG